jgi:monofunctional biosynthetic peptidoglycan transglycosylase
MKTTRISRGQAPAARAVSRRRTERARAAQARRSRRRGGRRRLLRTGAFALAIVLLAPALPIALLRFAPPPGSALMVQRWAEARAAGRSFRLRYDWVPAREIAPSLHAAVIASEDQRFFEHAGFDWRAMESAVGEWRRGDGLRGASTISQQVAKNLFLWPGRSFVRKALEAWLTLYLEVLWPKERILEVYLNVAELGDGVFGVEAAARHHFGRRAAQLGPDQAALLAAMLPSPRRSNPARPSRYLLERQHWILRQI